MELSHLRSALRWPAALGLTAVLALQTFPVAAQPELPPGMLASTGSDCAIQLSVANPTPGEQQVPRTLSMSGTAVDTAAPVGAGISQIQAFVGNRDQGGELIGVAILANNTAATAGVWSLTTAIPEHISGGQSLVVYSTSSVSGQEAFVSIPIVVGEALTTNSVPGDASSFCPSVITPAAPANPPVVAPTPVPTPPAAVPTPAPAPVAPAPVPAAPLPVPVAPAPLPVAAPAPAPAPTAVQLSISSPLSPPLTFDTNTLTSAAGAQATLTYTNNSPIPHNWHLFNGPDSSATTIAATQIMSGPSASDSVNFTVPTQSGNYFFWCDVHPTIMTGNLVVN